MHTAQGSEWNMTSESAKTGGRPGSCVLRREKPPNLALCALGALGACKAKRCCVYDY
ncbi:Hypothetical predicted protein [Marmota monax]|uniref:Uncharacterized protein n=1 Tax=Marmota monax TaxID=9995 RepID=A0A5E4CMC1_MARMO|nr:hypothetical protein GHT09_012045 [Marmota monax]VTJ82101.1 Hypothetical predicted protein [Marmota monax]